MNVDDLAPAFGMVVLFAIPAIAIIGGIVSGIVRTISRQRIIELAQRERIVAIERGIDPSKLPPLPTLGDEDAFGPEAALRRARHRSQGLMVGGIITLAVGFGLMVLMLLMEPHDNKWAAGIIPTFVGIALLLSSWLVRPRNGNGGAH